MTFSKKDSRNMITIILLFLPIFFNLGCSKKTDFKQFSIEGLKLSLQAEHKYFDTNDSKSPNYYFYNGWRTGTRNATSPTSIIRFFNYSQKDRILNLVIVNPHSNDGKILPLKAYLNYEFLQDLTVEGDKKEFTVTLPQNRLNRGENFIIFKLKKDFLTRKVIKVGWVYKDYFTLENIYFKNTVSTKISEIAKREKNSLLIQPANSAFCLSVDPGAYQKIKFGFEVKKLQSNGKITFFQLENKKEPKILKTIKITDNSRHEGEIDLTSFSKRTTLEVEYLSQNQSSFLNWEQISRGGKKEQTSPKKQVLTKLKGKPHFFYIIIDAARYDVVNKRFQDKITTPRIKEFSQTAYNFSNFYVNAPYTVSSVGTIFSGFLPEVHTVREMTNRLPKEVKTMPTYFEELGYETRIVTSNVPLYTTDLTRDVSKENLVFCRQIGSKEYRDNSFVDIQKVKETISKVDYDKPQFFYIHLLPPHSPYNPPDSKFQRFVKYPKKLKNKIILKKLGLAEKYNMNRKPLIQFLYQAYLNNVYYADYLVGEILDTIRAQKIFDKSCIIIGSDHGEAFFEHQKFTHNTTNYNEMIHIPFLFKLPGQKTSYTVNGNFSTVDVMPTLHQLFGIKKHKYWQGQPIIFDQNTKGHENPPIYSRALNDNYNISLIYKKYKYLYYYGREELYDLSKDPTEKQNIINQSPDLRTYLRQKTFEMLDGNINLKSKLKIKEITEKKRQLKVIEELKTLGYLDS